MKTDHYFRAITEGKREAALRAHKYGVFGFTKAGKVAARPSVTFVTEEEASKKAAYMETVNDGKKFTVRPL